MEFRHIRGKSIEHNRFAMGNVSTRRTVEDGCGGKISVRFLSPMDGSSLLKKGEDCNLPQEKIDKVNNLFTRQNNVLTLPTLEYFNEVVKLLWEEVKTNADWKYFPAEIPVFETNHSPPDIKAEFTFTRQHDPGNKLLVVQLKLLAGRPLDDSGTTMRFIIRTSKVVDGKKGADVSSRPLYGNVSDDARTIGDILYIMSIAHGDFKTEKAFVISPN